MSRKSRKFCGTIEITSGKIICSDPCYEIGVWCTETLNAKNGKYNVYIATEKEYDRCAYLEIIHEDYKSENVFWDDRGVDCGVDSGTFGFFDYDYYEKFHTKNERDNELNDEWYLKNVCDVDGDYFNTDNKGFWSQSGFGDGSYPLNVAYLNDDSDVVIGVRADFIYEDEDVFDWRDEKGEGDTSFNEFQALESDALVYESFINGLINKAQNYNVSEDKFCHLYDAITALQKFSDEMEIARKNIYDSYHK